MSARRLSIVSNKTFRGACGASAVGALVALTTATALALARGAVAAALADGDGFAAGSGSDLQAAETKPQATNIQDACRAMFAVTSLRHEGR